MKQKGQSAVEFALLVPLFFTMCFGMIYGAMMFMDYLQYNNAAGRIVRDISLLEDRGDIIEKLNAQDKGTIEKYSTKLTNLYDATFFAEEKDSNIILKINFTRTEDFPGLLDKINFPPKNLGAITVTMPLQN